MSIVKKYVKKNTVCKATFLVSAAEAGGAQTAFVVGDFNDWTLHTLPMKRLRDGSFKVTIDLAAGQTYQFRYLFDDDRWENDWHADTYAYSAFGNCENSVLCA